MGYQSTSIKDLFSAPGLAWSVGSTLAQTLFDGGLRRAVTEQARAVYQGTVANYRQTVLTAFQQVEDALSTLRILTDQIQQQKRAADSAKLALDLEMNRYENGLDPYVDVVIQQNTLLSAQQVLTQIEIQRVTASVQLIQALGGGWDRSQLPTPQQITGKPAQADTKLQQ